MNLSGPLAIGVLEWKILNTGHRNESCFDTHSGRAGPSGRLIWYRHVLAGRGHETKLAG